MATEKKRETEKRHSKGIPVQDWFDEEEAKSPGFIAEIDEANLRGFAAALAKELREGAGLTQAELAKRLGVSQPVVARIESGKVMPDLSSLDRIAHAVGYMIVVSAKPQPGKASKSGKGRLVAEGKKGT